MISGLNQYKLDTMTSSYDKGELIRFGDSSYDLYGSFGITRQFKGEEFYHLKDNVLWGEECKEALVSAINGVVWKIYYRHYAHSQQQCKDFRDKAVDILCTQMGRPDETRQVRDQHTLLIWDDKDKQGNVIFEADEWATAVYLTSSAVKAAPRRGLFQ